MFNARFINDCAPILFLYVLMGFNQKHRKIDRFQVQANVKFLRQFLKTTDSDSDEPTSLSFKSARPDVALFRKFKDCELSDKVFVLEDRL